MGDPAQLVDGLLQIIDIVGLQLGEHSLLNRLELRRSILAAAATTLQHCAEGQREAGAQGPGIWDSWARVHGHVEPLQLVEQTMRRGHGDLVVAVDPISHAGRIFLGGAAGFPVATMQWMHSFIWAMLLTSVTIHLERLLWPSALAMTLVFLGFAADRSYLHLALAVTDALVMVNMVLVWSPWLAKRRRALGHSD